MRPPRLRNPKSWGIRKERALFWLDVYKRQVQEGCKDVHKVSDYRMILEKLAENEFMEEVRRGQIDLGTGRAVIKAAPRQELFYQIIGDVCGYSIEGEYHLCLLYTSRCV